MRLRSHIKTLGKRALEQSGKYPVNKDDEDSFGARGFASVTTGFIVMAGLVPAIHVFSSTNAVRRGCPEQVRA